MDMYFRLIYFLNCICVMSIYVINYTICRLHHCDNTVYTIITLIINRQEEQCSVNQRDYSIFRNILR
jgi:hypothetical protein